MKLLKFLYQSRNVKYESNYPVLEAIDRLKEEVHTGIVPRAGVSGKVSERRVFLYRVIPLWFNSFAPQFVGRFETIEGKLVLSGKYSMNSAVKLFVTFWLVVTLIAVVIALVAVVTGTINGSDNIAFVLVPCSLFVFALVLIKGGQWFSQNDIACISKVVEKALK
jgi:hypothetical protein